MEELLSEKIDTGLNITRSGKDISQLKQKVISTLDLKFSAIAFRVTLPKYHKGIGAVEHVIEAIKNTVSKSVTGPHQVKKNNEELHTWLNLIIQKINNRPVILGASQGIMLMLMLMLMLTPNLRDSEIIPETPIQQQLTRWNVVWKKQG